MRVMVNDNIKQISSKRALTKGMKKFFLGTALAFFDLFLLYFSFSAVASLRLNHNVFMDFSVNTSIPSVYMIFAIFFLAFLSRGLYSFKTHLFWDEMLSIIKACGIALMLTIIISFSIKMYYSRFIVIFGIIFFAFIDMIFRYLYRKFLYKFNIYRTNVLIIGAGEMGDILSQKLISHSFTTYYVIGFLDDDDKKQNEKLNGIPVLGKVNQIDDIIKNCKCVDEIIVAIPSARRKTISKIITHLEGKVRRIKFIPDMYALITFSTQIQDIDGIMAVSASQGLLNPFNQIMKRAFDIVLSVIGLILLIPLSFYVWIKVKKEDGANVFFTQPRVGKNGKTINIIKFRSMVPDAEKVLEEMMEKDPKIREEYLTDKKLKNDPRITNIGKFLRKTSLDEFPQFINVFKGEMSIVGPRPYLHREINDMDSYYQSIIKVKPGLSGPWQTSGRSDIVFKERLKLDEYYVRNWNFWYDLIIVLKTIKVVLDKKGAY
ncbi:MAG TPA: sugar transferase [Tepiditoga sp.]|nr:sugar transferase [Tepiditoga sp.]